MSASLFGTGGVVNVNVNGTLVPQSFTATAGQTLFTLTGWTYTVGTNSLIVFINGQKQVVNRDYTETSTNSFTLFEGCVAGDFVDVIGFPAVNLDAAGVLGTLIALNAASGAGIVSYSDAVTYAAYTVGAKLNALNVLTSTLPPLTGARSSPNTNFDWFTADFSITKIHAPGKVSLNNDLYDVWNTKFSSLMTGGITYVDATNGNDTTGTGAINAPYATIDKAIRNVNSGLVYVMPGTYSSTGFRYTDTQGNRPKMIVAPYGGVKITTSGDTLSAATFVANGTFPNTYETTLVSANWVTRVLDNFATDELGLPYPIQKYSSIATVDASGYGWWYDSSTKKLYVRIGTLNVNTVKSRLSAIYATGGDNSLLVLSASLYLENIILDGYVYALKSAGQAIPQVWLKNCTVRYAESNSRNVFGGYCYSQRCTYYRSAADHANYNISDGTTARGVEINDTTLYAGDIHSYGSGATQPNNPISISQNKNSSSNHDSYVVRINGIHTKSYGPVLADTDTSYTWNLGVTTEYSYATGTSKYGLIVQGAAARAWVDCCDISAGSSGINADSSAIIYNYNSSGSKVASSGGSFSTYYPV